MQLEEHRDEQYEDRTVVLDNKDFQNCTFQNCTLVYGGGPLNLVGNQIIECDFQLDGAAARTVHFIASFADEITSSEQFMDYIREVSGQ